MVILVSKVHYRRLHGTDLIQVELNDLVVYTALVGDQQV
jgi:hypothetical protein